MRVVILADGPFASRERAMLARLEVGLVDEGARVFHAIPEGLPDLVRSDLYSEPLLYAPDGMPFTRRGRVRRLVEAIEERQGTDDDDRALVDIVHAFGTTCWGVAGELARQTGATLVLEVWTQSLIARARAIGASRSAGVDVILLTPDRALERALLQEGVVRPVRVTPWGVHTPAGTRTILDPEQAVSVVVSATGRDPEGLEAAVRGLAAAARAHDRLMIFLDAHGARASNVWRVASRLKVLDRLTLVPQMQSRREPVLRGDLFLQPERLGEHTTLLLDAMATGMAVVAASDPMLAGVLHPQTARLIDRPDGDAWAEAVSRLLDDPEQARLLGASARQYVKERHRASAHVAAVLDAYEWTTAREPIPFAGPDARQG